MWRFPVTIERAANLDRERLVWSVEQARYWDACLDGANVSPIEEISPRLSPDAFCETRRFVENFALLDRFRA